MEPPDYEDIIPLLNEDRDMGIGVQAEEFGSAEYSVPFSRSAVSQTALGLRLIRVRHAPYSRSNVTAFNPAQMNGTIAPRVVHQQHTSCPAYDLSLASPTNSHTVDQHVSGASYLPEDMFSESATSQMNRMPVPRAVQHASIPVESVGSQITGMLEPSNVQHASVPENSVLFPESTNHQMNDMLVPRSVQDVSISRYVAPHPITSSCQTTDDHGFDRVLSNTLSRYSTSFPSSSNHQATDTYGPRGGLSNNYIGNEPLFSEPPNNQINRVTASKNVRRVSLSENELEFLESTISHMSEVLESRRAQQQGQDMSISRQNIPLPTSANSRTIGELGFNSLPSVSYSMYPAPHSTTSNRQVIDHYGSRSVLSDNYPMQRDYAASTESTNEQINSISAPTSLQRASVLRYLARTSSTSNHQTTIQPTSRSVHCTNNPRPFGLNARNMPADWALGGGPGESVTPNTTNTRYSAFHLHSPNRQTISDCGFNSVLSSARPRQNIPLPISSNYSAHNLHVSRNVHTNTYPRLSTSVPSSFNSQASSGPIVTMAPHVTPTVPRLDVPFPSSTRAHIGSIHSRTMQHTSAPLHNHPYLQPEGNGVWRAIRDVSNVQTATPVRPPHHQHLSYYDVLPSYEQALNNMNSYGNAASHSVTNPYLTPTSSNSNRVIRFVSHNQNVGLAKVQNIPPKPFRQQLIETHSVTYKFSKTSSEPEECVICFIEYENGDEVRRLPCLHFFHKGCIDTWLLTGCREVKINCPCCRMNIVQPQMNNM